MCVQYIYMAFKLFGGDKYFVAYFLMQLPLVSVPNFLAKCLPLRPIWA